MVCLKVKNFFRYEHFLSVVFEKEMGNSLGKTIPHPKNMKRIICYLSVIFLV